MFAVSANNILDGEWFVYIPNMALTPLCSDKKKLGYNVGGQHLYFFMDTENHRYRQVNYIAKLHLIGKTHDFSSYMMFIMYLLIRFSHVLM